MTRRDHTRTMSVAMSRLLYLVRTPVRVTSAQKQTLRLATAVPKDHALDLLLTVYEGTDVAITLITGMQTSSEEGWVTLGQFVPTSSGNSVKVYFEHTLRHVRWEVTSSGNATFNIRGRAVPLSQKFKPTSISDCILWLRSDLGITLNGSKGPRTNKSITWRS